MTETGLKFTCGNGFLEPWLANLRARKANNIIPPLLRTGRILDIGCGSYPYFLSNTSFREKFAIDKQSSNQKTVDIHWHTVNLEADSQLPFENGFFQVITMLAVIEHLDPSGLVDLFKEARRTLAPGGMIILTAPSAWTDGLLQWMAKVNLVSAEEINEHKFTYTLPLIGWYFGKAGFDMRKINFGYFELMMNMWATAEQ